MRSMYSTVLVLVLVLHALSVPPSSGAEPRTWQDGTVIIQQQRDQTRLQTHAVPHQPFAAQKQRLQAAPAAPQAAAPQIGELQTFWIVDFTRYTLTGTIIFNEDKVPVDAELVRISAHAYLYLELGYFIEPSALDEIISAFETSIYPNVGAVFGPPPDALDGDPHVTILASTFPGTSTFGVTVAGYFDDANQYTDSEAMYMEIGHSNEREMVYVNVDFLELDPFTGELDPTVLGISAHEYQHLVHWGVDRDESVWLNEGCSEYAMHVCGYDDIAAQHMEMFSIAPTVSLTDWEDRIESYGAVYYFMRYLADRFGGPSVITTIAGDPLNDVESVDAYLRQNVGMTFRAVFRNWAMANLLAEATGDYAYGFLETPVWWRMLYESFGFHEFFPVFFTQRYNSFSIAEFETYLPIWTGEYYLFHRAAGEIGAPFYGYVSVDGVWNAQVTYVGLNQFGTGPDYVYTRSGEFPVQLDATGYGEFQIPTTDSHFALVIRNMSAFSDEPTSHVYMTYRIRNLPGYASNIVNDQTPPGSVSDLTVESVEGDRVTLRWTAPGDDGLVGQAALYDLRYSTNWMELVNSFDATARVPTVSHPGLPGTTERTTCLDLPPSTVLFFRLRTEDDAGNVSWSGLVGAMTGLRDVIAPERITSLHSAGGPPGQLTVRWLAPGDDGATGTAAAYDLRWSLTPIVDEFSFRHGEVAEAPPPSPAGTLEEALLTGLPSGAPIYVAIRARDEMDNISDISNVLTYDGQSQPPSAVDDNYQAVESALLVVPPPGVLANDSDPNGDPLSATLVTDVSSGMLAFYADGSFGYTPDNVSLNFSDFTIQSYGGPQDASGIATIEDGGATLHLEGNGWKKIAYPYAVTSQTVLEFDFRSGAEGEIHGIGLDEDDNPSSDRTFKLYGTQIGWGIMTFDDYSGIAWKHYRIPIGQYFTGNMNYLTFTNDHDVASPTGESRFSSVVVYEENSLADQFTYKANDGSLDSNTATARITVLPRVNPPGTPLARDDAYEVVDGSTLAVAAPGILGNDDDPDADPLSAVLVGNVGKGTLNLHPDGSFEYTPDPVSLDFGHYLLQPYGGAQDAGGAATVEDGGATLRLAGNCWKRIDFPYLVTPQTVLEFDFQSDAEGEIQGIGLDEDDGPSPNRTFKLHGTQAGWGIMDFDNYSGVGWKHYRMPVGQYFTGNMNYLTFTNDHDVPNPTARSRFRNVAIYENGALTEGFTYRASDGALESNVATVRITIRPRVTPPGTPIARDDAYDVIEGTTLAVPAPGVLANDVDSNGDPLAITLLSDVGRGSLTLNADGSFEYTPNRVRLDFNGYTIGSYGGAQDASGVATIEDGGATLHLAGNGWKKIGFPYAVTSDTVLEFDFQSDAEGEIHGIGLDEDDVISANRTFQLYGTQVGWGFATFKDYSGNAWKHYRIPVGRYFTGDMLYLTFTNDHDVASPTGECRFSNVAVYEEGELIDSFTYRASDGTLPSNAATVWIAIAPESR